MAGGELPRVSADDCLGRGAVLVGGDKVDTGGHVDVEVEVNTLYQAQLTAAHVVDTAVCLRSGHVDTQEAVEAAHDKGLVDVNTAYAAVVYEYHV